MKIYKISFIVLVFVILGGFVTEAFAQEVNTTITSVKATLSNPGYISNAGKANITVSGTAPSGSTVVVTLTDSATPANSITNSQVVYSGATSYNLDFNGTLATPKALVDGPIRVSAHTTASGYNSTAGTPVNTTVVQQTVFPIIYIIGDDPFKCRIRLVCPDLGAVAFDSFGNKIVVTAVSYVRISTEGNYGIRYSAKDSSGNESTAVRRVSVFTTISNASLSTTTPDMTNIPTGVATTSVLVPVEIIPAPVEPILIVESAPVIKISGISETVRRQLLIGVRGEDVKLLQTLFSKDSIIYPEGLITGYFGNLTRMAVQRFQVKYGIALQGNAGYGQVGPKTKAKLIEVFGM